MFHTVCVSIIGWIVSFSLPEAHSTLGYDLIWEKCVAAVVS